MASRSYTVVYEPAEGGGFYARIPALNLTTEGKTLKEAQRLAQDAVEGYIEVAKLLGKRLPKDVTVGRVDVSA